ncbi:MAG: DUF1080 domain-containing protein [Isosphaeraceae bacterium]
MEEPNKHKHLVAKVVGGLFGAVIAPILTGIALYYIQKKLDDPKPDAPAPAPAQVANRIAQADGPTAPPLGEAKATTKAKDLPKPAQAADLASAATRSAQRPLLKTKDLPKLASAADLASAATPSARRPALKKKARAAPRLFNGRDLTGFDTFLGPPRRASPPYGRNNDPEQVFTVAGGQLHISGKVFGGLVTQSSYANYHLTVEYKWGEKKWHPRLNMLRLGGIVLHASGEPGEVQGWSMAGITCQIGENDTGSLVLPDALSKPIALSAHAERVALKKADRLAYVYKPGAPLARVQAGSIHQLDYVPHQAKAAPGKAARGLINPVGHWNKLECICEGDRITIILNGTVVNVAIRVSHTRGKIFFESRGAEIFFRTIDLKPLS